MRHPSSSPTRKPWTRATQRTSTCSRRPLPRPPLPPRAQQLPLHPRPLVQVPRCQVPLTTVLGLEEGKDCVFVGILFKNMKLKPSILDEYSKELVASLPIDIMPGRIDPAIFSLPEQPLHRCLFARASTYNMLSSCLNPHQFKLDNVK